MDFGNSSTYSTEPFDPDNDHFYSLMSLFGAFVLYVNSKTNDISSRYRIIAWILPSLFIISVLGLCFIQLIRRCIDNNNQERERERMSEQEAGENDIPPNAKYTKIVSAQRYCFQIIFLVSVGIFTAVGFFLASSKTSSQLHDVARRCYAKPGTESMINKVTLVLIVTNEAGK
ncbi:hypothetical protein C2G38_2164805 [Gigaspora rosea]|uniref:Uncharacterized protein n=1 Tax=Gigaspora rosea TaxID=44941 RepID=A0A397W3H5_9GLOM|nr:hypothetical protein C2G38_2164805 [Gigaspora rosea]